MIILGIESSCDETAAAIVKDGSQILGNAVASQIDTHSEFGGVVPELASREHVDNICYVVEKACREAGLSLEQIEAIAVTRGPGLAGALLVGLSYAKGLAFALDRPLVGINHLEGHIYSIFLDHPDAPLPALSLVVSGGHTNLYLLSELGEYRLLAKTRDDAAGEAFDKLAKKLSLGYPGGPIIERLAACGDPSAIDFPVPRITDQSLDFSYSGLKSAVLRYIDQEGVTGWSGHGQPIPEKVPHSIRNVAAAFQKAVIDQLIDRLEKALGQHEVESIHVSGGVSCNKEVRERISSHFGEKSLPVFFPRASLTTDNAAMIAGAAFFRLARGQRDDWSLEADPNLSLTA